MALDYAIMLDPQYTIHGVEAEITVACGEPTYDVTVIDKTNNVRTGEDGQVLGIEPMACVRVAELDEKGIKRRDLADASISFNGKDWTIRATEPRPVPTGEASGELLLILEKAA